MKPSHSLIQQVIAKASESAQQSGCGPFAAAIVKGDQVIAWGHNQVVALCDPTAHAEVNAIRQACKELGCHDLSGYELYSSCEPCPMCLSAIAWAHLDKVYFAATRHDAAEAGFDDNAIYTEFETGTSSLINKQHIDCDTKQQPFIVWAQNQHKVPY